MLPISPPKMQGIKVYFENGNCYIFNRNANYWAVIGLCAGFVGFILLFIYGRCAFHPHYCPGINYQKDIIIGLVCIALGIVSCFFLFSKRYLIVSHNTIELWKKNKLVRSFPRSVSQIKVTVESGNQNARKTLVLYDLFFVDSNGKETKIFGDLYRTTADDLKEYIQELMSA